MRNVKMHYDGWVQLPAGVRNKLALETKDELTIRLVDGGVLLRPASKTAKPVPIAEVEATVSHLPARSQVPAVKQRAAATPAKTARNLVLPAGPRPRGRRKAAPMPASA